MSDIPSPSFVPRLPLIQRLLLACVVAGSVKFFEYGVTGTAWGGPFTVLMIPVVSALLGLKYVTIAAVAGLPFLFPPLKLAWARAGMMVFAISAIALLVLLFSESLGLRQIEPVSGYSMMAAVPNTLCYVLLVFPIIHLPPKIQTAEPSHTPQSGAI